MKRKLLAGAAVALTGLAGAPAESQPVQVTVGGHFGAFYNLVYESDGPGEPGADRRRHGLSREAEIVFRGATRLDNGLSVGVVVELEAEDCADQIDESFVWFEGSYGRLEIGATDSPPYKLFRGAPTPIPGHGFNDPTFLPVQQGAANLAFNPTVAILFATGQSEKVAWYSPRIAGVQIGASFAPDGCEEANPGNMGAFSCGGAQSGMVPSNDSGQLSELVEVAGNWTGSLGDVTIAAYGGFGLGHSEAPVPGLDGDNRQLGAGISLGLHGWSIGAAWRGSRNHLGLDGYDRDDWQAGLAYGWGDWQVGLQVHRATAELLNQRDRLLGLSVGGTYSLGPGIRLAGGVQHVAFTSSSNLPANQNRGWHLVFGTRLDF